MDDRFRAAASRRNFVTVGLGDKADPVPFGESTVGEKFRVDVGASASKGTPGSSGR